MSGKIFIVGIGPGSYDKMTLEAVHALENCDEIIGYTVYTDLLKPYFPEKLFESTPMKQEIERCRLCFDRALSGKTVALVCSGDSGVYGMASPMLQLQNENSAYGNVELCVIPGVTAAISGSAVLGAPLNHDFCVISLSDLLTPWETIEKRLVAAIQGDFAVAIYNPSSHKRKDYLAKACRIMLDAGADKDRACGFVENIGREGTKVSVCTLSELAEKDVNMFTTVFIGNSQSEIIFSGGNQPVLLTKRGYKI
ncbi:MAG: precorrin-3B C(17)-methyltransferase [Treponemataceae bacterium]|nr:precorrin-3B C(17)-methyltransferase [Treponemataceae bacterium]